MFDGILSNRMQSPKYHSPLVNIVIVESHTELMHINLASSMYQQCMISMHKQYMPSCGIAPQTNCQVMGYMENIVIILPPSQVFSQTVIYVVWWYSLKNNFSLPPSYFINSPNSILKTL